MLDALVFSLLLLAPQQTPTVDHSDKRCVVTEVVNEGSRSDCGGWKPTKGEKMIMPPEVNKRLKVGDTFYFVWKETRWVAGIKETVAITLSPDTRAIIIPRSEAEAQFKKLCAESEVTLVFDDGNLAITLKRSEAERLRSDPNAAIDSAFVRIKKTPIVSKLTPEEVQAAAKAALADQDQMLRAFAAALNPMPDWPQFVMNNDPSVCNRDPKPVVPVP